MTKKKQKRQPKFITVKKSLFDNFKFGIKIRVGDLIAIDENGVYYKADGNRYE